MKQERVMCVTKESVNSLIELLNKTIELLDIDNEHLTKNEDITRNHELRKEAESEIDIYKKVSNMMKDRGHPTLCLSTSTIKRKGIIKMVKDEEDEDIDTSEVGEPRRESEEPGTMGYF